MKLKTDDQLVSLVADGSQKAFEELFNRYAGIFLGYAMSIINEKSLAEDITQEIWIKIVKLAASYKAEGHFVSWAYTMIRNQAFNLLKSKGYSAKEDINEISEHELKEDSFEQTLIDREDNDKVKEVFSTLPEMQRTCLTLWLNDEMSYEQISTELGITVASVKTHLFRAKDALKKRVQGRS